MKIAVAQINSIVGDFSHNTEKIIEFTKKAEEAGCAAVFFPELAVCGYPPMDLLDQDVFTELNIRALRVLQKKLPHSIACAVGYVNRSRVLSGKSLVNAYGVIKDGALIFEQIKTLLPTYDVFDEARNFESASSWNVFEFCGERIGFAICEDAWRETETPGGKYAEDPVRRLMDQGITMLCVPSASPYYLQKHDARLRLASRIRRRGNVQFVYINAVGANDSIIFDGRSFVLSPSLNEGADDCFLLNAAAFTEDLLIFDSAAATAPAKAQKAPLQIAPSSPEEELDVLEEALVMGIREYMIKCGFSRCHLGLSGGIDSALAAFLAVRAVGAENVTCFSMPSRFSSPGSRDDAFSLSQNLGCRYETLPIESVFTAFLTSLEGVFEGRPFDVAEENLQARIRGVLLMAFSNKFNSMLIATGNKSELAMGYCTLYGDMNGALAPIGDLFKTEVFALCNQINKKRRAKCGKNVIPQEIIDKPPSAELRPNQKDQDSLPPYETLDDILRLYLFQNQSADEIALRGVDRDLVSSVIKTAARAEFKRRQAPPVLKVSPRAFGMGRRMPIARFVYEN
ncbi:MAG: NAD+ synthase [Spirochaetaceae bacterium]|jgi:NAD+ synthase (glutamine-hydrolysing)|nr:NAD+ synthase [Spirochaetaceae bacterium]